METSRDSGSGHSQGEYSQPPASHTAQRLSPEVEVADVLSYSIATINIRFIRNQIKYYKYNKSELCAYLVELLNLSNVVVFLDVRFSHSVSSHKQVRIKRISLSLDLVKVFFFTEYLFINDVILQISPLAVAFKMVQKQRLHSDSA